MDTHTHTQRSLGVVLHQLPELSGTATKSTVDWHWDAGPQARDRWGGSLEATDGPFPCRWWKYYQVLHRPLEKSQSVSPNRWWPWWCGWWWRWDLGDMENRYAVKGPSMQLTPPACHPFHQPGQSRSKLNLGKITLRIEWSRRVFSPFCAHACQWVSL